MAEFTIKPMTTLLKDRKLGDGGAAQVFVDSEVLRRCSPYVPFDSGTLNHSGVTHTRLGSGEVIYATPYARRWYYQEANFQGAPMRGTFWFEKMKKHGGRDAILRGVAKITGGNAK